MTQFRTKTIDGQSSVLHKHGWQAVQDAAAKYHRAIIEIHDADKAEISEAQRRYFYCREGPIKEFMRHGWSAYDAKNHLKVRYGRHLFVKEVTDDNFQKAKGELFWECQIGICRKLIHPAIIARQDGKRVCPFCHSEDIKLIAIKSIMDKSVKQISEWFQEIFSAFPRIKPPDSRWYLSKKNRQ